MDTNDILAAVDEIAAHPGKNDKQSLLAKHLSDELFKRVMVAAYDPNISYGIKQIPVRGEDSAGEPFDERTWTMLAQMRDRQLTGGAMQAAVAAELQRLSPASAMLLQRILLKDMRAGFTDGSINKALPGTIVEYPYMRCCLPKDAKLDQWKWEDGVLSQEKADGMFFNVDHEDTGEVFLSSRQGSPFPVEKFPQLEADVKRVFPRGTQSHGEMLVMRDGVVLAREIGNGILNSIMKGGDFADNERPVFMAWDQIPLAEVKPKGKYEVPYKRRFLTLLKAITSTQPQSIRTIPTRVVKSLAEAYRHYAELLAQGKEGTIIKNPAAIWKDGTSKDQVKLKLEFVVDLEVVGFEAGNGKNAATFGSMITRTSDGLLEVAVSGISDKLRAEIHANREEWTGSIIAVRANGIMKPSAEGKLHSLFLPRYVERRTDKKVADTLAWVFAQEDAAKLGAAILKEAA